jgi:hypothetical protein
MNVEDLPKGRIKKFEYMAVIDGLYYDVFSIRRKTGKVNVGYGRGTYWADLKDVEKLVKTSV